MEQRIVTPKKVEQDQFRHLLQALESRNDIAIRLRLKNDQWLTNFFNVLVFVEDQISLSHLQTRTVQFIPSINEVVGFEINESHMIFKRFERYYITTLSNQLTAEELRDGEYSF